MHQVFVRDVTGIQECDADVLGPGFHFQPELHVDVGAHTQTLGRGILQRPQRNRLAGLVAHEEVRHVVQLIQLDALTVERDFKHFAFGRAAEHLSEAQLLKRQFEEIFAVERKIMAYRRAAARSHRKASDGASLREVAFYGVRHVKRTDFRIAYGHAADLCGRRHVALEQRRRNPEHVGDIIEAVA